MWLLCTETVSLQLQSLEQKMTKSRMESFFKCSLGISHAIGKRNSTAIATEALEHEMLTV